MHSFVSTLTAAALFLHTVLGCCWHHAQCQAASRAAMPAVESVSDCCHHGHTHEGQPPANPGKCQDECGGACTYLLPQKTQVENSQVVQPLDFLVAEPAAATLHSAFQAGNQLCFRAEHQPPLRLHLLHQVLLN